MKLKIPVSVYFIVYFCLLMLLYHFKIKDYFYWRYIEELQEAKFEFSTVRFFIAMILFFLNLNFLLRIKKTKLAYLVLTLFFILLTIPSLIAFTSGTIYPTKILVYHQGLFFGIYLFSKVKINFDGIPKINKYQSLYLLLTITAIGIIPYLIVYGPYINLKNLVLLDVYKTRSAMSGLSNPYFGYTYSLFTKIVIPLIIVFALELRKIIWVITGVVFLMLFYLFGAHKTVYMGLIIVLIFYRFNFSQSVKYLTKYSSIAIIACIVLALFNYDYPWILSFRRVHFIPTLLDICYIDFFTDKPIYWSESILNRFIEYPYEIRSTHLIGETYFNRSDVSANNGLVSEGFMNLGSCGVIINCFLIATYFMILNNLKISAKYFGLFFLVIFSFISSSVFTVFLTHGALALLLVSMFLLNNKE